MDGRTKKMRANRKNGKREVGTTNPTTMDPIPCRSQVLGVASLGDEVRPILGGIRRVAAKIALVPRVSLQGC